MNQEKEILKEIENIKDSSSKLYSYLYNLIYEGKVKNMRFLEDLYSSFLSDDRMSIKQISIYALLFGMQIKKEVYKQKAIEFIRDLRSSEDLRMFSLSGLSQAYMDTNDVELLVLFFSLFKNEEEDGGIRATCFTGMLRIVGFSTVEVAKRNGNVVIGYDDIHIDKFQDQISKVEALISTNT